MGMRDDYYFFSWFIRFFSIYLVIHLICSMVLALDFSHVPFYIPFLVFILFDISLIIQNFFIQVFLIRAKIGIIISMLFFLVQFIMSYLVTNG